MAGLNSILQIFLPKDRVFFQLFESVVDVLVKMGEKLKEVVHEPDFDERGKLIKVYDKSNFVEIETIPASEEQLIPTTSKHG